MRDRRNDRKRRENRRPIRSKLLHYIIVTDTEETEKNYFLGLQESLPDSIRDKIVIKCINVRTKDLVERALEEQSNSPQLAKVWIVVDRDMIRNFDELVDRAQSAGIEVGWSNPCIEILFSAYFGSMPVNQTSVLCNREFSKIFKQCVRQRYLKTDVNLYKKLFQYGDEKKAISIAAMRYKENKDACYKPTDMLSTTKVHLLLEEITAHRTG